MRIAHIVCVFPPYKGGIGNAAYNFARISAELGNEVTVFTPDYKIIGKFSDEKFKIIRLKPLLQFGNGAILPQLLWSLNNFDIVHFHYPFYGSAEIMLLSKILNRKKIQLILHYHHDNQEGGWKGKIFNLYRFTILPLLTRVSTVITAASLDYINNSFLKKYYKNHPEKFRETYFGVDTNKFKPKQTEPTNFEHNLLFVGGLDASYHDKGLDVLLQAVKTLKDEAIQHLQLTIVGNGNQKEYYRQIAKDLGIEEMVNLTQNVDDQGLVDYYNKCDCLILPAKNKAEAFGIVLIEALSCGKPVIASDLPGVRSVFKNGQQGLTIKPNDVNDLVEKIKIIINNKEKAKEMGRQGRILVENRYAWSKVGEKLNSIYQSTVKIQESKN